ncbi:EF-hand calcium-binding domain-containing protein 1-like isoform X2 [Mastomys coucha]|uniref:EF-hand calcium-binding domain-containing protein 1-like isoform X2 n=1 Tax=Mastomys coucha TaxID=35658 RepID=UPI00126167EF|nr:EF-hand calcium-binding domain-containing protein 1-like isoform X2 [Mastomys coucha]
MEQRALKKLVEPIRKTVKSFKKSEVECLIQLFYSLVGCPVGKLDNTRMDRNTFRGVLQNIFGMTNDLLMNRVFFVFDKDGDSYVNLQEWIKGLAVFLRGTFEEKMRFCFEVYYLSGDAYISREKIFDMLKSSLFQHSPEEENEEGIKDLVEISLKKMDYDNDGKISFADFEKAVKKDGLLLETCFHFEAMVFKNNPPASF